MHTHWIFMALASLGRLGQRGILGQSSILDNLQGRLGQCGLGQDWDNGYPLADWDMWDWHPGAICKSMDTHWISMALAVDWDNAYPLDLHGIGIPG